jgi:hypothetical protein
MFLVSGKHWTVVLMGLIAFGSFAIYIPLHLASSFKNEFGVNFPFVRTQAEADEIQPVVTQHLRDLNHRIASTRLVQCSNEDMQCLKTKLANFHNAQEGLAHARSIARALEFDTFVPKLCANGTYPREGAAHAGYCDDGSIPTE